VLIKRLLLVIYKERLKLFSELGKQESMNKPGVPGFRYERNESQEPGVPGFRQELVNRFISKFTGLPSSRARADALPSRLGPHSLLLNRALPYTLTRAFGLAYYKTKRPKMVVYVKDNNSRCIKILIKNFKVKKKFFNETICQNINDKLTYFQQIFNFSGFPYLQVREVPTIIFGKRTGEIIDLLYSSETKRRLLGYNKKVPQLLIRYKEVNVTSLNLQGYNQLCNS